MRSGLSLVQSLLAFRVSGLFSDFIWEAPRISNQHWRAQEMGLGEKGICRGNLKSAIKLHMGKAGSYVRCLWTVHESGETPKTPAGLRHSFEGLPIAQGSRGKNDCHSGLASTRRVGAGNQ